MSDIPSSSQATISQALTQLSQTTPTSELARQGVEVLVKHLAGNTLSLNRSTILQNKVVLLNNPKLNGKLAEGQTHQIKYSLGDTPSLEFFSSTGVKTTSVISLTEQQIQSLFRLPARHLVPSSLLAGSEATVKLPMISATVLPALPKELINIQASPEPQKSEVSLNAVQAKNTSGTHQQNILRLLLTDQRPPVEIALPVKQLNQFTAGEKIGLAITPKGNNWQLTIVQNKPNVLNPPQNVNQDRVHIRSQIASSPLNQSIAPLPVPNTTAPNKLASPLLPQAAQTNTPATEIGITTSPETRIVKDQQIILPPLLAIPIIKASLGETNIATTINLTLPIKLVLQQLSKVNNEQNQGLVQKLQTLPIDKISLQMKSGGEFDLVVQSTKAVANIPVTKEIAQALAPLKLPSQQAAIKLLDLPAVINKQLHSPGQSANTELKLNIQKLNTDVIQNSGVDNRLPTKLPPVDGSQSQEVKLSLKESLSILVAAIQDKPIVQSMISPSLLANKPDQINLLQSLLRIVQAKAEAPAITLQSIEKALVDVEFFKGATEQPSKQLVDQLLQQIKQALPQGKEQDANQIRQLLTTPALNLSALQMISPTSGQGFMSGLITLLQMSLSARLSRNQTSRVEHITETLNNVLRGAGKDKPSVTSKAMSEMSQLEQKHQLMKEIGRLLSAHQTSKLSNAEQMIQGQETFYYNLPSALGGTLKDIELLIKREDNNQEDTSANEPSNKTWQLTMKLAVGEMGELLTKAKLRSDNLEIDFYASNEAVKIQVMNYLPLLLRKFDSLGIDVSKSHCQLGKIPDTLQQRPYHMFQAKA